MADTEFHDPERMKLLEALKTVLDSDTIPYPTVWACLWLSDVDCLRDIVHQAQSSHLGLNTLMSTFRDMERSTKIVQQCVFTT
jgi:hypothetical protein